MGHGAARELSSGPTKRELPDKYMERMTEAMDVMDGMDATFKSNRDDEKEAQLSKLWGNLAKEIEAHLRVCAEVLIKSHQISLDMGTDGAGKSSCPWMEETGWKWEKLRFELDGKEIRVHTDGNEIGRGHIDNVTLEWVEEMTVEWCILSVELFKNKHGM